MVPAWRASSWEYSSVSSLVLCCSEADATVAELFSCTRNRATLSSPFQASNLNYFFHFSFFHFGFGHLGLVAPLHALSNKHIAGRHL
jgi:hypothetical protein